MGKQSSRIYFGGMDHKEIYFDGHYHDKMYLGKQLVWEKQGENIPVWGGRWNSYRPSSSDPIISKIIKRSKIPSYGYVYNDRGEVKSAYVVSCTRDGEIIEGGVGGVEWYYAGPFDVFLARSEPAPSVMKSSRANDNCTVVFFLSPYESSQWITLSLEYDVIKTMLNNDLGYAVVPGRGKMCRITLGSSATVEYEMDFVNGAISGISNYNDEHGTLFADSDGNLYFTRDGLNWQHIGSGFDDRIDYRTAWHNGKYLIVRGADNALVDTSGFHYPTRPGKQIAFLFTMDNYFYISYEDGVLQRTMDLKHYDSLYVGECVFGARGGTFLAHAPDVRTIMYYAKIDF